MKKAFMILVMVFIMATLVACGSDKITSNNPTNEVVATPDSTTETQQNEKTVTNEATESNNQMDTPTDEGLAAYAGAYTDGTNYLVIEGENITLNGHKCEVTRVVTDHFKSGVPVYYFMYENNEISIYYDEVCGMGCSLEQPEGSWLTYETIDIAQVPHFDVEDEQVADAGNAQTDPVVDENQSNQDSSTLDSQVLTDEKLMTYLGNYTNTSTSDTFSLVSYDGDNGCTYRADQIAVNDVTRTSPDRHASVFAAKEFDKNDDGNYYIRRSTMYGFCTITLLSDNHIYLKLECSDWSYEGTFSKQ